MALQRAQLVRSTLFALTAVSIFAQSTQAGGLALGLHHRFKARYYARKHGLPYSVTAGRHGQWGANFRPGHGCGFGYRSAGPVYVNPYCSSPIGGHDYAAPLQAADEAGSTRNGEAAFRSAHQMFLQRNFPQAGRMVTQAVQSMPKNGNAHQLHALILFAQGNFQDAAAVAHNAMTIASGWQWADVQQFYRDRNTYASQLRALEAAASQSPQSAELNFLLGYHYLMLGQRDLARTQFARTLELEPRDAVSRQIVTMLAPGTEASQSRPEAMNQPVLPAPVQQREVAPAVPTEAAPAPPTATDWLGNAVSAPTPDVPLVGTWKALSSDNVTIMLTVTAKDEFFWTIIKADGRSEFSGRIARSGAEIELMRQHGAPLKGRVSFSNNDRFDLSGFTSASNQVLSFQRQG